jgi:Lon protease-like protein
MKPLPPTIRLFPLGEVVHFPDTLLPLHVFEARYRRLLADALEDDRLIGMVLLRAGASNERPEIYDVGCAGEISSHEALEDGRSLIVLQGLSRFRIRRERDGDEPYRVAEIQALYEPPPTAERTRQWAVELRARLDTLVNVFGGDPDSVGQLFERIDDLHLVNALSAALPLDVVEKQGLLECPTIEDRYRRLLEVLAFKEAEGRFGALSSVPRSSH